MKKINEKKTYTIIFLCGIIFCFLYSISTSPLTFNFWGSDSAFFQMAGKAMNHGMVMYKDIFDIKGPYLFFIEFLGYATGFGRYGIFLIQCINICVILFFLQKCVNLIETKRKAQCAGITYLFFFFFMACTLECGNLSEEYALPYICCALYLFVKYLHENILGNTAFIYGICFGIAAMGRVTNAALIAIIVFCISVMLVVQKQWKMFGKCVVLFTVGLAIAVGSFFAYYAAKGALQDMVEAVFTFSFSYAVEGGGFERLKTVRWPLMIVFFISSIWGILVSREWQKKFFLICELIGMGIILNLGNAYIHYYQLLIPCILSGIWFIYDSKENTKHMKIFIIFALICNLVYFIPYSGRVVVAFGTNTAERSQTAFGKLCTKIEAYDPYGKGTYGNYAKEQVREITDRISPKDKNNVFNYETKSQWFTISGLFPYNKYCITADHFSLLSPKIANELEEMFTENPPKYVVMGSDAEIENVNVQKHLRNEYREEYKNESFILFRRRV